MDAHKTQIFSCPSTYNHLRYHHFLRFLNVVVINVIAIRNNRFLEIIMNKLELQMTELLFDLKQNYHVT